MRDLKPILDNIPDKGLRHELELIINGKYVKQIRCLSKECKGRILAHIDNKGRVRPTTDGIGRMWLRASRPRLDGFMGFQCWCGNDSRLSIHEKGVKGIENNAVTKQDINTVAERLNRKPTKYTEVRGRLEVDNFLIEKIL